MVFVVVVAVTVVFKQQKNMAMSACIAQVCSTAPEESSISECFEKKFESSKH